MNAGEVQVYQISNVNKKLPFSGTGCLHHHYLTSQYAPGKETIRYHRLMYDTNGFLVCFVFQTHDILAFFLGQTLCPASNGIEPNKPVIHKNTG